MKRVLAVIAAGAAGVVGYRRTTTTEVAPSLDAEQVGVPFGDHTIATYRRGSGAPIVLVHSVNAAASAAEMRPLFDRLPADRRVVALDLLGYGRSSRPAERHTPESMSGGIEAVLEDLGEPCDIVALSLGCEFAARVAIDRPDLVRSLTLISPTGMRSDQDRSFQVPALGALIRSPIAGELLYAALASKPSIGYFLGKSFRGPVDPGMKADAHQTSRHRNARFAPASFLEGVLFTPHAVEALYERVSQPVLVIADEDPYTDFGALDCLLARHHSWQWYRLSPHRGLPQFEQPDATAAVIETFHRSPVEPTV
ncbi:MAG: alpha/beta fold hydrolase [Acidimicrobiia bacterium]